MNDHFPISAPALDPFNPLHPPFMTALTLPAAVTATGEVARAAIEPVDFPFVLDPAFAWQSMPTNTPAEAQRRREVEEAQKKQIARYLVVREQYWQRLHRLQFAEDTEYTISFSRGFTSSHSRTESQTTTEVIGVTLGLGLKGSLFSPKTAKAGKALARTWDGTIRKGISVDADMEFTWQLAKELELTTVDEQTYEETSELTIFTTYSGGAIYLFWDLMEMLSVWRITNTGLQEPVSAIAASTGITWTDRFFYRPDLGASS